MPTPSAANTVSACSAGMSIASPSEAPMNGAVQGEAMATASTPDRKDSATGWRSCAPAQRWGSMRPNSNMPARFKPSSVNSTAMAATRPGDCN